MRRAEQAGYAVVGKTNLHEFAYGVTSENPHFGAVPNPRAPGRVAGGSSGGSAAALAAGLGDVALGTDSAGSIRIPAACCGVAGFKPTHGAVPLDGCFPLAPSFDTAGPMARTVSECAALLEVLAPESARTAAAELEELEIGVAWLEHADPLIREQVAAAAACFPRRRVLDLRLPERDEWSAVFMREAASVHEALFADNADAYGDDVRMKIERCLAVTDAEVAAAERARAEYGEEAAAAVDGVDLVVTPTLPTVAPPLGSDVWAVTRSLTRFTWPASSLGWPALALPCGPAEDGLPASIQLMAPRGRDALVIAAGERLEQALAL